MGAQAAGSLRRPRPQDAGPKGLPVCPYEVAWGWPPAPKELDQGLPSSCLHICASSSLEGEEESDPLVLLCPGCLPANRAQAEAMPGALAHRGLGGTCRR